MTQSDYYTKDETQKVLNFFGKETYDNVLRILRVLSEKWSLSSIQFIPYYSANLLFTCSSHEFGNVVLKICNTTVNAMEAEYYALSQYHGKRVCKVYKADMENGAILEERIEPGNTLREQRSLAKRITIFCSLYQNLHVIPIDSEVCPTYGKWVKDITEYMSTRRDCRELSLLMKKAYEIYREVSNLYSQEMLLHGDFHHDNILLGENGEYKIIDPKGVIGDPVFDIPRFILNECDEKKTMETYKKIHKVIAMLEEKLNVPKPILKQCFFIETAMACCWCVQGGISPDEYLNLIKDVQFAETILHSRTDGIP